MAPRFDLPTIEDDTRHWWDAAHEHRLLIQRCNQSGRYYFYPRPFSPFTWSEDVEWVEASGRGSVYTFSTVHRNDLPPFSEQVPYIAAVVELEEGPRMMTKIVGCTEDDIEIGMPVEVAWEELSEDVTIPVFVPAGDA